MNNTQDYRKGNLCHMDVVFVAVTVHPDALPKYSEIRYTTPWNAIALTALTNGKNKEKNANVFLKILAVKDRILESISISENSLPGNKKRKDPPSDNNSNSNSNSNIGSSNNNSNNNNKNKRLHENQDVVTSDEEFSERDSDDSDINSRSNLKSFCVNGNDELIDDDAAPMEFQLFDFENTDFEQLERAKEDVERIMKTIIDHLNALELGDKNYIEQMQKFSEVLQARRVVSSDDQYIGSGSSGGGGSGSGPQSGDNSGTFQKDPGNIFTRPDESNGSGGSLGSPMSGQQGRQYSNNHHEELQCDGDIRMPIVPLLPLQPLNRSFASSTIDCSAEDKEICTTVLQCSTPAELVEIIMRKEDTDIPVDHCSPTTMGERQNSLEHRKLYKILCEFVTRFFVDCEMDEKTAATVLEDTRNPITNEVFSFTVTADPFVGLEWSKHTADHDAIVISSNNTTAALNARDFQRVIRSSGCQIPIILLNDDSGQQLPSSVTSPSEDGGTSQLSFSSVPRNPYTIEDLTNAMAACFHCDSIAGAVSMNSAFSPLSRVAKASSSAAATVPLSPADLGGDINKLDCFDAVEKAEASILVAEGSLQSIFDNEVTVGARQFNLSNRDPLSVIDDVPEKEKGMLDVTGMLYQCKSQQGGRPSIDTSMASSNGPMLLSTTGHRVGKLSTVDSEFSKYHKATQDEDVKELTANDQLHFKTVTMKPPAWVSLAFASAEGAFNKLEEQQTSACSTIEVWEEPNSRRLVRLEYDTSDSDSGKKLRQAMSANVIFITFPDSTSCYPDVEALRETIQQEVNALIGEVDVAEVWIEQCPTVTGFCALHFSSKKINFYDSIVK
eukprot:gene25788-33677_t